MKKFTNILESRENSKFIQDFKDVIYTLFMDSLYILGVNLIDMTDTNDIYIYNLKITFKKAINSETYVEYKKLFDAFFEFELYFDFKNGNTLISDGLLSDLYDVYEKFKLEVQSKKYNL